MEFIVLPKEKLDTFESYLTEIKQLLQVKPEEKEAPKWLPKKEAAKALNVCSKTLDSYLRKRIIPFSQFKGKVYIKTQDIDKHLEKFYVKP